MSILGTISTIKFDSGTTNRKYVLRGSRTWNLQPQVRIHDSHLKCVLGHRRYLYRAILDYSAPSSYSSSCIYIIGIRHLFQNNEDIQPGFLVWVPGNRMPIHSMATQLIILGSMKS